MHSVLNPFATRGVATKAATGRGAAVQTYEGTGEEASCLQGSSYGASRADVQVLDFKLLSPFEQRCVCSLFQVENIKSIAPSIDGAGSSEPTKDSIQLPPKKAAKRP